MSNFISDFIEFHSGSECPTNFLRWGAIGALSVAAGRKFLFYKGMIEIRPQLYIKFIGEQGGRKSYAKDKAMELVQEAILDLPVGADITSREDIIKQLASTDTCRFYVNHEGAEVEWHPLALFIDEFKNFVSFAPAPMINFLVNIFNRPYYKSSTLARNQELVPEPHLSIMACENPEWMVNNLKMGVLTGGYSRRFILIYEEETKNLDEFLAKARFEVYPVSNAVVLWARMKAKLQTLSSAEGKLYKWESEETRQFARDWYIDLKRRQFEADHLMRGFLRTMDEQTCRVAMLLDLAKDNPQYLITKDNFQDAYTMIDIILPNLPKLFIASGRNEMAVPQHRLLEFIALKGGCVPDSLVARYADADMNPNEQRSMLAYLVETKRLHKVMRGQQVEYCNPEYYLKNTKKTTSDNGAV